MFLSQVGGKLTAQTGELSIADNKAVDGFK